MGTSNGKLNADAYEGGSAKKQIVIVGGSFAG